MYLEYRVNGPVAAVINVTCMQKYHTIFTFLWRVKRMEHLLTGAWSAYVAVARSLTAIGELAAALHLCNILRGQMLHFINQVQYYFVFEVLECSYDEFLAAAAKATDLDDIIVAHGDFLAAVMSKALLEKNAQPMLSQLRSICDIVLRFHGTQAALCQEGIAEVANREKRGALAYSRHLAVRIICCLRVRGVSINYFCFLDIYIYILFSDIINI